ncbi:MAG: hypothetical protein NZ823_11755 [Blastocatellia bacterium]|nr:hypothetical protein [Blastocatellia bacterium]
MRRVALLAGCFVCLCIVVTLSTIASRVARSAPARSVTLSRNEPQHPPNDDCVNSISVTATDCPITFNQDSTDATDQPGEPLARCPLGGPGRSSGSVWYEFMSTMRAVVTVSTCGSSYDTVLSVYAVDATDACDFDQFVEVICNDDSNCDGVGFEETQSRVRFTAEPNIPYRIQVTGFDGASGELTIRFVCAYRKVVINESPPREPSTTNWFD